VIKAGEVDDDEDESGSWHEWMREGLLAEIDRLMEKY